MITFESDYTWKGSYKFSSIKCEHFKCKISFYRLLKVLNLKKFDGKISISQ